LRAVGFPVARRFVARTCRRSWCRVSSQQESSNPGIRRWLAVAIALIAAAALATRRVELDKRPMHGDEANQALKAGQLLTSGVYVYDRDDHHGPSLSYFTLPAFWLSGCRSLADCDESTLRIVPVVFGAGLILLLLLVADGLGPLATLVAAVLAAVSPAMFFYSRYYIQETLLVFFTFAAMGCGWRFLQSGAAEQWPPQAASIVSPSGRKPVRRYVWAIAAGGCLGMMHATKETWVLAALAAAVALGVVISGQLGLVALWQNLRTGLRGQRQNIAPGGVPQQRPISAAAESPLAWLRHNWLPLAAALLTACATAAVLLSSFGQNWRGPIDSLLAYSDYLHRGGTGGLHSNPWYFYLERLLAFRSGPILWSEALIAALAAVGCVAALLPRGLPGPQRWFCCFLAVYTIVLTGLYSLLPYKTPWCMLSFVHGMILLAGLGAAALLQWLRKPVLQAIAALVMLLGVVQLADQCYRLNFVFFADPRNPHVYAHPVSHLHTDMPPLVERLVEAAVGCTEAAAKQNTRTVGTAYIHVVTTENYWPVPWYLRRLPQQSIGYWQDILAWQTEASAYPQPAIILTTSSAQQAVETALDKLGWAQRFFPLASYGLRPGEMLVVYVRDDVWQKFRERL